MLTSAQTLLLSTLFSLLIFVSHGKESLEVNTTQNIAEDLKHMAKQYLPWRSGADFNLGEENIETSSPKTRNSSLWDPSNKSDEITDFMDNLTTSSPRSPRPTPVFSESTSLIHSFVSKLPQNSSATDENSLSISSPPNATSAASSVWSLANDTMKTDNSSITVSILPSALTTTNPMTTEPDLWLNITNDTFVGFTPYQEMTQQPTLKFTNNSKIFPNTSDPQEGKYKQI